MAEGGRKMRKVAFFVLVVAVARVGLAAAETRYVPDEYSTIQAAIDDRNHGDVVVIEPNTYTGDGNRDIDFKGLAITVRSSDPNDPCIVAGTIIDCNGSGEDPHRGFKFHSGEGPNSVIDRLTVTNGYGQYDGIVPGSFNILQEGLSVGGAVYGKDSNPTLRRCVFIGNSAAHGGAVYGEDADLAIGRCTLTNNAAGNGGGMYFEGSDPCIQDCIVTDNSAFSSGAGIYSSGGSPSIVHCQILGNSNSDGHGGAVYCSGGSPIISHCAVIGNWAKFQGGGISCYGNTGAVISQCIIARNSTTHAGGDSNGGGICCDWDTNCTIEHCTIAGNSCNRTGGGVDLGMNSHVTISHCILWANTGDYGDQIAITSSTFPSHLTVL
jgi:predicted outer membrane repeat protein